LVCIDELEARLALQDRNMRFEELRPRLTKALDCTDLVVTRGRSGFEFLKGSSAYQVPAVASRVVDPVGAGDAVLSMLTLCYATKAPWAVTAVLGAAAGAIACMSVGNREPVRKSAMMKFVSGLI
jgi:sugar/nucleoside kinase (ribokinase family)